jgi:drug/metabolite transporter (DMT)-like permease
VPKTKLIPLLEALFAVIVWGASFIATKIALQEASPDTIVWVRFLIGVIILGAAVAVRRQISIPNRSEWGYLALLGFLGVAFHQWLQSNALQTSEAGTTAWIVSTAPVFMAVLGWLVLRETLGWWRIAGILLAACGVMLVVTDGNLAAAAIGTFGAPGDMLILVSAVNWSVFSILSRRGLQRHPAAWMMFWVMLTGWLFTSVLFFVGSGWRELGGLTWNGWIGLAFLGIFCSGLAYIAWYDALQRLSAAQTGSFLYIEPLVTLIVAALVLAEPITSASILGGGIILSGVYLVNRA